MKKVVLLFALSVGFLSAESTTYECRAYEVYNMKTKETINDNAKELMKIGMHLTIANKSAFDGTYAYPHKETINTPKGVLSVYERPSNGDKISMKKAPISNRNGIDLYQVVFHINGTGTFAICTVLDEVVKLRNK